MNTALRLRPWLLPTTLVAFFPFVVTLPWCRRLYHATILGLFLFFSHEFSALSWFLASGCVFKLSPSLFMLSVFSWSVIDAPWCLYMSKHHKVDTVVRGGDQTPLKWDKQVELLRKTTRLSCTGTKTDDAETKNEIQTGLLTMRTEYTSRGWSLRVWVGKGTKLDVGEIEMDRTV